MANSLPQVIIHVLCADLGDAVRGRHCIAAKGLAELLIEHHLNECRLVLGHLSLHRGGERFLQLSFCLHLDALQAAGLSHLCILHTHIQLSSNEVVVIPQRGVPLLGTPLVIAEHYHSDCWPIVATTCCHLIHGDAERSVTSK